MKLEHVNRTISDVTGGNHENEGLKKIAEHAGRPLLKRDQRHARRI